MKIKKLTESKLSFKQYDVNKKKLTETYNWNKEFDSELGRTVYDCGDINGLHCSIFSEEDDGDWGYTVFIKNGRKILRHKPFNHINIDEVKAWTEKEMTKWDTAINSKPLKEELWDSSRVIDLVTYYLDRSNLPINTLANNIINQMKKEGSTLPHNITDFYDTLYKTIDEYNSQFEDDLEESLNGYKITIEQDGKTFDDYACAYEEDGALTQMKNKYGNDINIKNVTVSKVIKEDVQLKFVDDMKEAILTVYSRHPGNFSETIENFVLSHGADLTVENVFHNVSDEAVAELYNIVRNDIIKLYGPDYNELDSEVFDLFNISEELNEDVPMGYTDTSNFKNLQDESDEYQAELKRKNTNRDLLHKIFDKYGLRTSDEEWVDKVYWLFANAQKITVVDDASKIPHKTNDGQKIRYVISTPNAEVDVHADVFEDYIWVVTKDSLYESFDTSLDFPYMFFYNCNNPTYGYDFQLYARSLGARKVYGRYKGTGSGTYFYLVPSEDVYNKLKAVAKDKYTIDMQPLLKYNAEDYPNFQYIKEDFDMNNEFWTKEELLDFADDVCAHINETFNNSYDTQEVYLTNGVIELTVVDDEGTEFTTKYKPDMRKVKRPSHIDRFVLPVAADIIKQIKEQETITEDLSGKYSDKFRALIREYSDSDSVIALVDDIIRYAKEDDLKDLFIDRDYEKFMPEETLEEKLNLDKDGKALKRIISRLVLDSDEELKDFVMEVTKEVIDERNGKLDEDLDVRANTNKVISLAEEDIITWQSIAEASLMYMSEVDVADMARLYNWVEDDEDEEEAPYSVRKVTNEVTELAEDGVISWESIARAALRYMSEYDVTDMASMYSWIEDEDNDLYESFNEKDFLHKLDQFQTSITVKPEDEKTVKNILRNKNISFKIDDSKEGKLKFKLNYKALKEDFEGEPLMGPQEGPEAGMATLINTAIQDEFSTIQLYNDIAVTARAEGFEDIANVIDAINTDENTHVGQLQDLLKTISPNAAAIDDETQTMTESGNTTNSPKEWAEQYHEINKLEDFVSDNLNDGTLTEEDLMKIAEESSTIEIDDMKRAINSYKNK